MIGVVLDAARHDGPIVPSCLGLPTAMSYQKLNGSPRCVCNRPIAREPRAGLPHPNAMNPSRRSPGTLAAGGRGESGGASVRPTYAS
jgi:hypothetical protein